jgi:hypothetical protein
MVGIAEEPPRQLAPSVGSATLDFVIRAGFIIIISVQITSGKRKGFASPPVIETGTLHTMSLPRY